MKSIFLERGVVLILPTRMKSRFCSPYQITKFSFLLRGILPLNIIHLMSDCLIMCIIRLWYKSEYLGDPPPKNSFGLYVTLLLMIYNIFINGFSEFFEVWNFMFCQFIDRNIIKSMWNNHLVSNCSSQKFLVVEIIIWTKWLKFKSM